MATVRELITELNFRLDRSALREFDSSIGEIKKKASDLSKNLKEIGRNLSDVGGRLTLGFTLPFAAASGAALKFGSDAQEVQNAFNVLFKDIRGEANKFASSFAKTYGRSTDQVQDSLLTFQSLFVGMGANTQQAFEFSKELRKLTTDFSSFRNVAETEAVQKFLSGLSGEIEPLRRFGVNLSANNIELKLQEMGLAKSAESATQLQKAIARLNIIRDVLSRQGALGDALRTQDQFANASRRLTSRLKEMAVSFGKILIPAVEKAIPPLIKIVDSIASLPKGIKITIFVVGGLLAIIGPLLFLMGKAIGVTASLAGAQFFLASSAGVAAKANTGLGKSLIFASKSMVLLLGKFLLFVAIAAVIVGAIVLIIDEIRVFREGGESVLGWWVDALEKAGAKLSQFVRKSIAKWRELVDAFKETPLGKIIFGIGGAIGKGASAAANFLQSGSGGALTGGNLMTPEGAIVSLAGRGARAEEAAVMRQWNVSSTIEMTVPEGTPETQKRFVQDAGEKAVEDALTKQIDHVIESSK